jgi:hypothetical protein
MKRCHPETQERSQFLLGEGTCVDLNQQDIQARGEEPTLA